MASSTAISKHLPVPAQTISTNQPNVRDAAEAAFKKARQGGGDAQLKCTDIFDDAVEFITKPQDS